MTDLLSVVDDVGTPVYVYDLAEIRANQQRLRAALPERAGLYYPLSANPHPELLREIRAGGALPEVRSPGELDAALVAGWAASEVLYTGPGWRDKDVDWALWLGVRNFTVDSPAALEQLDRLAGAHRAAVVNCLLRVSAPAEWVLARSDRFVSRANAHVVGLHVCVSGEPDALDDIARFVGELTAAFARHRVRVRTLNLGGGFDVPLDSPAGSTWLAGLRERLAALEASLTLRFEFGRYLVDTAGTLVTAVLDVREEDDRQVVVLESGAGHVGGFVGRSRRLLLPRLVSRVAPPDGELVETAFVSAQEVPVDVWARSARLPRLRLGDLMAVPNVGACGLTAGMVAFTAAAIPVEVVVDRDDPDAPVAHVSRLTVTRYPEDGRHDR